jgi:hypothetical protein
LFAAPVAENDAATFVVAAPVSDELIPVTVPEAADEELTLTALLPAPIEFAVIEAAFDVPV